MPVTDAANLPQEAVRGTDIPASTQNRLYKNRRHFFRRKRRFKERLLDEARTSNSILFTLTSILHARLVRVWVRHMRDARNERAKPPLLLRLRTSQRKRAHRAPGKAP